MTEAFLHYIWQYQYFSRENLRTTGGELVSVLAPGQHNRHAGPDFLNARIRIGELEWRGSVEIHVQSAGWKEHGHDEDPVYENVILHVVWSEQAPIYRYDGSRISTIELKSRVAEDVLLKYRQLLANPSIIPCSASIDMVDQIIKRATIDQALMERLESKASYVLQVYAKTGNDWSETTYQIVSRNLGFKTNADPMETLAKSLPLKIILKHADRPHQVEAMLFGQSGLLETVKLPDDYTQLLEREYKVLNAKYGLDRKQMTAANWRFLRMRPPNFPTVRLAQLASLIVFHKNLFSSILECDTLQQGRELFNTQPSPYWYSHYTFGVLSALRNGSIGSQSISNLIINSMVPLLVAYGKMYDQQLYIDRAIDFLEGIGPEPNTIIKQWTQLGMRAESAADSQALIQLHNESCLRRRCLNCSIGAALLKP